MPPRILRLAGFVRLVARLVARRFIDLGIF